LQRVEKNLTFLLGRKCPIKPSNNKVGLLIGLLKRSGRKAVGRDYDEILKTKLGHLVIAEDGEEARSIALGEGYPPEMLENYVIYGTPARIKERIIELQDAGVEYLIVNIHAKKEEAMLELFAEEVVKSFS